MAYKRYWDGEHPNLNDISVCLDGPWVDTLTFDHVGLLYRLVWFFASRCVHSAYSEPSPDPLCTTLTVQQIGRICYITPGQWKRARLELAPFFEINGDEIRLIKPEFIRLNSRPRARNGLSAETRAAIFSRDGDRCTYCASTVGPFHVDHIMPVAKGGSDAENNLTVACAPCNLSKSDRTLQEWVMSRMLPASTFGRMD